MIYPADFESKIGFDSIRGLLYEMCESRLAKDEVTAMKFMTDYTAIMHSLRCVSEMMQIKNSEVPFPGFSTHDVISYLVEIKAQHSYMSADRVYKLLQMLISFEELRKFFDSQREDSTEKSLYPELAEEIASMSTFPQLIREISNCINKFGEIKDTASPELYEIRQQIKRAGGSMQRAMRRVIDAAVSAGIIDKDTSPSIRDGRLVIPVAAGSKRAISGIVHDESSTGKTVFIEPSEVVEAGNRLRELHADEKREEIIILLRLADMIRPDIENIAQSCHISAQFEFVAAKASFAIDLNATMPHISNKQEIEWYSASHPGLILSLRKTGRNVVPLNIHLDKERRILIISGPNAGGKSVCLKTVAVVQYMMQCGMMPTLYDNSHMGVFKKMLIDIGDEQSFENDLSTYSSHLRNMRVFVVNANAETLILADEMGSGTEPQIGGAMAQAILENLGRAGCYGVVTTHYQNLKTFAEETPGFVNGAMLYDRAHLAPTFQLSIGNPGSSFAIDIAHKMGIPLDIINEAKRIVGEEYINLDKYLSDIARDKKYWQNKRQNIREKENKLDNLLSKYEEVAGDLKSQRRAILEEARKEAKEILDTANAKIERTILEIRKVQAEKEKTKELRNNLKEFARSNQEELADTDKSSGKIKELNHKSKKKNREKPVVKTEPAPKVLTVGDNVKMEGSSMVGEILTISGKKAVVAFGGLRTIVELTKLQSAKKPSSSALSGKSTLSSETIEASRKRQLNFRNEIDVRGMRADEAIQAVTYFLDDAIQFGADKVRILHGTGHGILKTLIRQQLKANGAVVSFEDEDIRFGGAGITVVNLA